MILGVTGTGTSFQRLVDALAVYARASGESVWVQHGPCDLRSPLEGAPFLPHDEMLARMRQARAIVTHAGCGTLLDAISLGHKPVVVPRLKRYGEHVNDHQLELLDALSAEERIFHPRPDGSPLEDLGNLIELAAGARQPTDRGMRPEARRFLREVRGAADSCVSRVPTRRRAIVLRLFRPLGGWADGLAAGEQQRRK
jgi:UDP-N-acetylglucosamine transferase subunit ALG13